MIPSFPEFKKVEITDRESVESLTRHHPPYSTFNFTNLLAWDIREDRGISQLNGNLVVLFTDYATTEPFLSFFGDREDEDTVRTLLRYAADSGMARQLRFITEESVLNLHAPDLSIEEDRTNSDYLFSVADLAELHGPRFKRQRHLARRFAKEYPDAVFRTGDLEDPGTQNQVRSVLRRWEDRKKQENKAYDSSFEEEALNRLLRTADRHRLILSCVLMRGTMLGFSIDEILPGQDAMAHFIKADNSFKGIYEFTNERIALHLAERGVVRWNWQQDLDLDGLRETKMKYRPIGFLKKYTISS